MAQRMTCANFKSLPFIVWEEFLGQTDSVQVGWMGYVPAYGGNGNSRNVSCSKPSLHCRKRPWEGALYKWLSAFDAMHMALYKWSTFYIYIHMHFLLYIIDMWMDQRADGRMDEGRDK